MISGLPPRILLGLIVAADADPALRPPLRKLIKQVRARIRTVLEQAGVASDAESVQLFHAAVVGLAVMHDARRTPASAREVKQGIAGMLQLLRLPPSRQTRRFAQ